MPKPMRVSTSLGCGRMPETITATPRARQRRMKSESAATPEESIIGTLRMRRMKTRGGVGMASSASRRLRARSEEHTSELQSLMRISYAVFCLKKKKQNKNRDNKKRKHQ